MSTPISAIQKMVEQQEAASNPSEEATQETNETANEVVTETPSEPVEQPQEQTEQPQAEAPQETQETSTEESKDTTDSSLTDERSESGEGSEDPSPLVEVSDTASEEGQPTEKTEATTPQEFDNVNDYVAHLKGEVDSDPELKEALLRELGVSETSFANEQMAQLNKFVSETGRTPNEFFYVQELDTANMQPIDAIRNKLYMEYNGTLTVDQIDKLVSDRYKLDEDEFSEREVELGKIQMTADSNEAKKWLNNLKEEYSKPIDGYTPPSQKPSEATNFLGMDSDTYLQSLKDSTELSALEFELGDKKFEYKLTDEYNKNLYDSLANSSDPLSLFRTKEGGLDTDLLAETIALRDNFDKIVNAVYTKAKGDATKEVVTTKKNVDFSDERSNPAPPQPESDKDAQDKEFLSKMYGRGY